MQPACAIPPYDPETLKQLVGLRIRVKRIGSSKFWWREIVDTRFVTPKAALVKLAAGPCHQKPRWIGVSELLFQKHTDDPLAIALQKARAKPIVRRCAEPVADTKSPTSQARSDALGRLAGTLQAPGR